MNSRFARWALASQRYNFKIEHRKGSPNVVSDSLCRVYEGVIAAVDLREGLLVDMDSEDSKKAEYVDLVEKVKAIQANLPDLKADNGYYMCIGNLSTLQRTNPR